MASARTAKKTPLQTVLFLCAYPLPLIQLLLRNGPYNQVTVSLIKGNRLTRKMKRQAWRKIMWEIIWLNLFSVLIILFETVISWILCNRKVSDRSLRNTVQWWKSMCRILCFPDGTRHIEKEKKICYCLQAFSPSPLLSFFIIPSCFTSISVTLHISGGHLLICLITWLPGESLC